MLELSIGSMSYSRALLPSNNNESLDELNLSSPKNSMDIDYVNEFFDKGQESAKQNDQKTITKKECGKKAEKPPSKKGSKKLNQNAHYWKLDAKIALGYVKKLLPLVDHKTYTYKNLSNDLGISLTTLNRVRRKIKKIQEDAGLGLAKR